ncbi:MAG: lycopene cyclase domain-containing protein [Bacteroidetes bacterium]|nr:lycopene cyclase domain-containing protein [Bacteroidota bacterium]
MNSGYLYLIINIGTILFPLLFSFEKRVAYYKWWRYLFPALIITATIFLIWDYFFTLHGVWGFNPTYTTGINIAGLPLEEILFFITVPYASIFIYAFVNHLWPNTPILDKIQRKISFVILFIAIALMLFNYDKAYTALNCGYAIVLLSFQLFVVKGNYMGRFYRFYFWHLIPFFIVNGLLTGTGIQDEVVWYNNAENLGIRMGTIPVEDSLYSLSLMLMNITIIEWLRSKRNSKKHLSPEPI